MARSDRFSITFLLFTIHRTMKIGFLLFVCIVAGSQARSLGKTRSKSSFLEDMRKRSMLNTFVDESTCTVQPQFLTAACTILRPWFRISEPSKWGFYEYSINPFCVLFLFNYILRLSRVSKKYFPNYIIIQTLCALCGNDIKIKVATCNTM